VRGTVGNSTFCVVPSVVAGRRGFARALQTSELSFAPFLGVAVSLFGSSVRTSTRERKRDRRDFLEVDRRFSESVSIFPSFHGQNESENDSDL
jgi:hypothetical protein